MIKNIVVSVSIHSFQLSNMNKIPSKRRHLIQFASNHDCNKVKNSLYNSQIENMPKTKLIQYRTVYIQNIKYWNCLCHI